MEITGVNKIKKALQEEIKKEADFIKLVACIELEVTKRMPFSQLKEDDISNAIIEKYNDMNNNGQLIYKH